MGKMAKNNKAKSANFVTRDEFQRLERKVDEGFKKMHEGFKKMHEGFKKMHEGFKTADMKLQLMAILISDSNNSALRSAIKTLEEKFDIKYNELMNTLDTFLKRLLDRENDLVVIDHRVATVGEKHNHLATYCTEKIGYKIPDL